MLQTGTQYFVNYIWVHFFVFKVDDFGIIL